MKLKIREGKSRDWQEGYNEANEYFEHLYKGGSKYGSATYRIFVEAVAFSMQRKENMSEDRIAALDMITKWSDIDFNKGVRDCLVERAKEYRALKITEQVIGAT